MSWDLSVFGSESPPPRVDDMPKDWAGTPLGPAADVRAKLSAVFPELDWTNPTWGLLEGPGFSFEFNMGREELLTGFMIHVRGSGDPVPWLMRMGDACTWYMLDTSTGEWMHHLRGPNEGWQGLQDFRDGLAKATRHRERK
jgi:hypothetical protein